MGPMANDRFPIFDVCKAVWPSPASNSGLKRNVDATDNALVLVLVFALD
jgi:hypothetical protein